jgi:uncharacterized protein
MASEGPAADPLLPIPLQELKLLENGKEWQIHQPLNELSSLTPVRGSLRAVHRGNVLELEVEARTIVTLCCDRCLQQFNHPLSFETREVLWLGEQARVDGIAPETVLEGDLEVLELDADALTESLDPSADFDPEHWVFEQLNLQLPVVNRCGEGCPGPNLQGTGSDPDAVIDPRWAALKKLQP